MRAERLPAGAPVRVAVWVLHLALPMFGLWLLLGLPAIDVMWHDPPSHFWLVLSVAVLAVVLGVLISSAARRHADPRLFLVSLVFLLSAGFLALHALTTPGVLVHSAAGGFTLAQPVGLALASVPASLSALPRLGWVLRWRVALRLAVLALLVAWAVLSLVGLHQVKLAESTPVLAVSVVAVALYLLATLGYFLEHRRRPAVMLISVLTAFALLAEATVAVTWSAAWHLSWWEWHLLLLAAFGFVAYSADVQYRREGSAAGVFDAITLASTERRIRADYEQALESLVSALADAERDGRSGLVAARVAQRFSLTEGQAAVLDRAGSALAAERDLSRRLRALVQVGDRARVGSGEQDFLRDAVELLRPAYGEVGVTLGGQAPAEGEYPLTVRGRSAGVLTVPSGDGAAARLLASQLSIALENVRLYGELETLFRSYLSPDVAASLLADPSQAGLGGSVVEVTALFADLRGFTTFAETVSPADIVAMLNAYHGVSVPCVLSNGGTVVQFVGDALLALFNAPARQPDHALRAVRAALAMQSAVEALAAEHPDWPRFRVGLNTGPALVGNIGSETLRGFNAMGDAVNVASRLQGLAEPGQVVAGAATLEAAGDGVVAAPLGELAVKGRRDPVWAHLLTGLR